jgi:hypothetical protein
MTYSHSFLFNTDINVTSYCLKPCVLSLYFYLTNEVSSAQDISLNLEDLENLIFLLMVWYKFEVLHEIFVLLCDQKQSFVCSDNEIFRKKCPNSSTEFFRLLKGSKANCSSSRRRLSRRRTILLIQKLRRNATKQIKKSTAK